MHHHRPYSGASGLGATSTVLKWIFVAIFILFLGLHTIPASTDIVQREETTLKQHRTTHHLDAGLTSSPLTKAMKVLLQHLPGRRSEGVSQDNGHALILEPNGMRQGEEYNDSSNHLSHHDDEAFTVSRIDHIDPPNARELHDDAPFMAEKERHVAICDLIGHDNTGHLCSTMECFCKSTGRCRRESIRNSIAYEGPGSRGKKQRAAINNSVEGDVGQNESHREDHEWHEIPHRPCQCGQHHEECRCGDHEDHSAERLHATKGIERVGISAIPHIRPSDPSSKLQAYRSNERDATDGYSEKKSFEQGSNSPLDRPIIDDLEVPGYDLPQLNHGSGRIRGDFSKPSSSGFSKSSRDRQPVHKRGTPNYHIGSKACDCHEHNRCCHCYEVPQPEHLLANQVPDMPTLPIAGKRTRPGQFWAGHTGNGHCTCESCTSFRSLEYNRLHGSRDWSRDLAKSHNLLGKGANSSPTSLADISNILPDEGGNFADSVHLAEAKNRRDSRTESPGSRVSEIDTAQKRYPSKWQFDRASLDLPQSFDTNSLNISSAMLDGRQPCHKLWRVNTGCSPRHIATQVAKAIQYLLRRDSTLIDSITEAKCSNKVGAEKEECEQKHRTGFWIVCSVLAVAGTCGLLLAILVLHLHFRRKGRSPLLTNKRPVHKSVASSPVTSVSEIQIPKVSRPFGMRRIEEDEIDETGSVRRYTTLDGATDGWTRWIHKQKYGAKVSRRRL